jgi:meso-butanediol dehydrogenase / (S,S)-butanediol dehydrogenase / diacetyl reductase
MAPDALAGKVCLVTGAGSGIGAAIADRFAAEGATVIGADLRPEGDLVRADVAVEADVVALMETVSERAGSLDILVNVAGIGSTTTAPDTPVEVWDEVLAVNARGTFLCCKHAIPAMVKNDPPARGAIVNMASVAGLVGLRNRAAYCAAKGAVISLTRALAVDHVAQGVRVNCICPGTVDSPWVRRLVTEAGEDLDALRARQPMGRLGTPDEVAEAALYLASPASSFVTGSVLVIDGGLTAA